MLKIALIYESPYVRGRWRRFDLIHKHLKSLGHEVRILAFSDSKSDMEDVVNVSVSPLFRMIGTLLYFLTFRHFSNPVRLLKTCLLLRKMKPDVVVFHYYDIWLFLIASRFMFNAILVYDLNDLNTRMGYYRKKKSILFRLFCWIEEVFIPRNVNKVITPTNFGKRYLASRGADSEKIFVLNELVDMESFSDGKAQERRAESFRVTEKEKVIIWHGVIRHYQADAIAVVMKAVSIAQEKIPNIKLLVVGPLEKAQSKEKLSILANKLKINVEFTGRVPTSQIPKVLNSAHVGIQALPHALFTRYINGVKLSEYICSGLPVLCSNLEGPAELVRGNGFLFVPEDSDDLADKIIRLFESDYEEFMKNSNKIAKEEFSKEAVESKITNLLKFLTV